MVFIASMQLINHSLESVVQKLRKDKFKYQCQELQGNHLSLLNKMPHLCKCLSVLGPRMPGCSR